MEIFKDIEGYEGYYQASNYGRIKSLCRGSRYKNFNNKIVDRSLQERILVPALRAGYYFVVLSKESIKYNYHIHRLVCETFHERVEGKNIVNHKDGNKLNNNYNNLEWCTQKENRLHAIKTGLDNNYGENMSGAILKDTDIFVIFMLLNNKVSHKKIAEKYNVDRSTITSIANRKSWTHLAVPEGFVLTRKQNGNSKLTENNILHIRSMLSEGHTLKSIAEEFKVSIPTISNIRDKKIWGWV